MTKKTQDTVETQNSENELEEAVAEAKSQRGKTPKEVTILIRELSKMLQAVRLSKISELAIGTYFVPFEGQLGIEGIVKGAAQLMNQYVKAGWQPWQMGVPYQGTFSFDLGGQQTGALEGQWITIVWAKPAEEVQI